jgi:hypothetical protein
MQRILYLLFTVCCLLFAVCFPIYDLRFTIHSSSGCLPFTVYCLLSHLRFQALPFYQGLGYRIFGELPEISAGQTLFFLSKLLNA